MTKLPYFAPRFIEAPHRASPGTLTPFNHEMQLMNTADTVPAAHSNMIDGKLG